MTTKPLLKLTELADDEVLSLRAEVRAELEGEYDRRLHRVLQEQRAELVATLRAELMTELDVKNLAAAADVTVDALRINLQAAHERAATLEAEKLNLRAELDSMRKQLEQKNWELSRYKK
jgi:predicted  nucleic acid-binding Zn-ribbon protein